jgi:hypothetical protein
MSQLVPTIEDAKRRLLQTIETEAHEGANPLDLTAEALFVKAGLKRGKTSYKALKQLARDGNLAVKTIEFRVYSPATKSGLAVLGRLTESGLETVDRNRTLGWMVGLLIVIGILIVDAAQDEPAAGPPIFQWALLGLGIMTGGYMAFLAANFVHQVKDGLSKLKAHLGDRYGVFIRSTVFGVGFGLVAVYFVTALTSSYLSNSESIQLAVVVFATAIPLGAWIGRETSGRS